MSGNTLAGSGVVAQSTGWTRRIMVMDLCISRLSDSTLPDYGWR